MEGVVPNSTAQFNIEKCLFRLKIRSTKHEIRNKFKIQMTQIQNSSSSSADVTALKARILNIRYCGASHPAGFGFSASDLVAATGRAKTSVAFVACFSSRLCAFVAFLIRVNLGNPSTALRTASVVLFVSWCFRGKNFFTFFQFCLLTFRPLF
jgi:hypothetical protein